MLNRMNKHINHLSWPAVKAIEKIEHGMPSEPTKKQFMLMESVEHELKKPTMAQLLKFETKEHIKPEYEEEDDDEMDNENPKQMKKRGRQNGKS